GIGKGSGRSIEGLNLVEALNRCADSLDKYGGHEMAAGLAMREENFDRFAEAFRSTARALLSDDALQPCLRLDHELAFTEIDIAFRIRADEYGGETLVAMHIEGVRQAERNATLASSE